MDYIDPTEVMEDAEPLLHESLFACYTLLTRLIHIFKPQQVAMGPAIFLAWIQKMFAVSTIPFSGEPVKGLQLMGMLETRNLDFEHLLILSANEGYLPKPDSHPSFIPYNLRKAFGLITPEHREAIYAYHFFRLLQRASDITLVYNSNASNEASRGERAGSCCNCWPNPLIRYPCTTFMPRSPYGNVEISKSKKSQLFSNSCTSLQPEPEQGGQSVFAYLT
jgi:hypothetical protein